MTRARAVDPRRRWSPGSRSGLARRRWSRRRCSRYQRARDEANALFDLQLRQTAASIIGMPIAGSTPFAGTSADDGLVVQIWDRQGVRIYRSAPPTSESDRMPAQRTPGFATIDTPSGPYRVFSVLANGQIVQVGQPLHVRSELAARLALSTILPLALVTPLIAVFVWIAVRRGLAPLERVAAAVQKRSPSQLAPLTRKRLAARGRAAGAGAERAARTARARRSMRSARSSPTPRTSCARRSRRWRCRRSSSSARPTPEARARALGDLRGGLARATRVVEQLLSLAREEPGVASRAVRRRRRWPRWRATSSRRSRRWPPRSRSTSA